MALFLWSLIITRNRLRSTLPLFKAVRMYLVELLSTTGKEYMQPERLCEKLLINRTNFKAVSLVTLSAFGQMTLFRWSLIITRNRLRSTLPLFKAVRIYLVEFFSTSGKEYMLPERLREKLLINRTNYKAVTLGTLSSLLDKWPFFYEVSL